METVCLDPTARVEAGQRRVLDEATRQRRLTRQLEALEKDNFQVRVCDLKLTDSFSALTDL